MFCIKDGPGIARAVGYVPEWYHASSVLSFVAGDSAAHVSTPLAMPVLSILMHVLHYNDHNASFAIKTTVDTSAFSPEKRIQKLRLHFNAHFALKMIVVQYRFH